MKRPSISKSVRFRVFRRDVFTCQYCGAQAPDVPLEVDHKLALANGGRHCYENFVTACRDCNQGKGIKKSLPALDAIEIYEIEERCLGMDDFHLYFDGDPWLASFYGGICEG